MFSAAAQGVVKLNQQAQRTGFPLSPCRKVTDTAAAAAAAAVTGIVSNWRPGRFCGLQQ
jgi:hypothetical protein